jgi:hypothetical protein
MTHKKGPPKDGGIKTRCSRNEVQGALRTRAALEVMRGGLQ